jgi:hypothetical protein
VLLHSTALELSLSISNPLGISRSSYTGALQVLRVTMLQTLLPLDLSVIISCPVALMVRAKASLGEASAAFWPGAVEASSVG